MNLLGMYAGLLVIVTGLVASVSSQAINDDATTLCTQEELHTAFMAHRKLIKKKCKSRAERAERGEKRAIARAEKAERGEKRAIARAEKAEGKMRAITRAGCSDDNSAATLNPTDIHIESPTDISAELPMNIPIESPTDSSAELPMMNNPYSGNFREGCETCQNGKPFLEQIVVNVPEGELCGKFERLITSLTFNCYPEECVTPITDSDLVVSTINGKTAPSSTRGYYHLLLHGDNLSFMNLGRLSKSDSFPLTVNNEQNWYFESEIPRFFLRAEESTWGTTRGASNLNAIDLGLHSFSFVANSECNPCTACNTCPDVCFSCTLTCRTIKGWSNVHHLQYMCPSRPYHPSCRGREREDHLTELPEKNFEPKPHTPPPPLPFPGTPKTCETCNNGEPFFKLETLTLTDDTFCQEFTTFRLRVIINCYPTNCNPSIPDSPIPVASNGNIGTHYRGFYYLMLDKRYNNNMRTAINKITKHDTFPKTVEYMKDFATITNERYRPWEPMNLYFTESTWGPDTGNKISLGSHTVEIVSNPECAACETCIETCNNVDCQKIHPMYKKDTCGVLNYPVHY